MFGGYVKIVGLIATNIIGLQRLCSVLTNIKGVCAPFTLTAKHPKRRPIPQIRAVAVWTERAGEVQLVWAEVTFLELDTPLWSMAESGLAFSISIQRCKLG